MSRDDRIDPFSLRALRFHVPLLIGIVVCIYAGWYELSRAREGHAIAWVYAVEWPGFAVVGVVIWWRIVTDRDGSRPGAANTDSPERDVAANDPGLLAWQQYLADTRRQEQARGADPIN